MGGLLAAGFATTRVASAAEGGDSVPTMLNLAATAEAFAVTHVYSALTRRTFNLNPAEELQLKIILDAELQHLNLIQANGGQPLTLNFFTPNGLYNSRRRFAEVTANVETTCTGAYLAATRRFADLGNPRIAATMAQLAANEAQHIATARELLNVVPSDNAWLPPLFFNVSDAGPVLAPFFNGGEGFSGPVAFPGRDAVLAVLGDVRAIVYPTYINTF
jgi:hypothetical protein